MIMFLCGSMLQYIISVLTGAWPSQYNHYHGTEWEHSFPFVFSKMKTEAEKPNAISCRVSFQWPQWTHSLPSSKRLTSNCCLLFVLTSYEEALWLSCVCNETNWKHLYSGPLEVKPMATRLQKRAISKTRRAFDNLIIRPRLYVCRVHWVLTAAGSSRRFTTGNSCNVCHMCSHHQQSRKLLRSDLHLPQDRVYFLCGSAEGSGHRSALRPQIKGGGVPRWDDLLSGPGEVWTSVLSSAATPCPNHWECRGSEVRWNLIRRISAEWAYRAVTGRPPSAIHSSMTDGLEKKG